MASKLDQGLGKAWATVYSAGRSAIKRLVDEPLVLLESLQTVTSKLDQGLGKAWATVCSAGSSAIKRLVEDPDRFLVVLNTVANEIEMSAWLEGILPFPWKLK